MALTHYAGDSGNVANAHKILQPQMPTLARGVDQVSELNGRLSELHSRVSGLVDVIGGPRPVSGEGNACREIPSGIVDRLHSSVATSHARVTEINELLDIISRQLG